MHDVGKQNWLTSWFTAWFYCWNFRTYIH